MTEPERPLLQMRGIIKEFPGVRALDGVDLDVAAGEVHCLLGQNGAGKSTLIKVLAGAHQPDEGEISGRASAVMLGSPHDADAAGIATIYQELDLVAGLTVAENIFLGHEPAPLRVHPARRAARGRRGRCSPGWGTPRSRRDREVGTAVGGGPADRQHGAGAVAGRAADRDGRAVGGAGRRRGATTCSAWSASSPRRASRSSTSPTGSRRSARWATG